MFETVVFIRFGSFRCLSNDIALKGFFLQHRVVFVLFCVAIVISEPFFAGAYIRPDFAAFGRKNFGSIFLVKSETETREIHF